MQAIHCVIGVQWLAAGKAHTASGMNNRLHKADAPDLRFLPGRSPPAISMLNSSQQLIAHFPVIDAAGIITAVTGRQTVGGF